MGSSRLAKEYWRQYIKDIKPCFFPCTTSGDMGHYDVSASLESISIPFHETDELRIFAERHTLESSEILRTAWALVLRQYTDSDEVCFGVHYRRRDETMSAICRLHINPTDKICDVLSKAQRDALESEPYRIDLLKAIIQTASGPSLPDFCNSAILEQDGMSVDSAIEPVDVSHIRADELSMTDGAPLLSTLLLCTSVALMSWSSGINHQRWRICRP